MAAKPLDKKVTDAVLVAWRTGQYSIRDLADKFPTISRASIGKLVKGLSQDAAPTVDAGIRYRQALATYDGRMVDAIVDEVDRRVADLERLRGSSLTVLDEAMQLVSKGGLPMSDLKAAAEIVGKTKENIFGKQPDTAIQINNSQSQPKFESEYLKQIQADFER